MNIKELNILTKQELIEICEILKHKSEQMNNKLLEIKKVVDKW